MQTELTPHRKRPWQAGFTLVEVMVVVAIIGITASLALIYIDGNKAGRTVEGYAERLGDEFSLARQRAIASQKRQRLVIEAGVFTHWQSTETGLREPVDWDFVFEKIAPRQVTIVATDPSLHVNLGVNVPAAGSNMPMEIDILPDGRARSATGGSFFEPGWTVFIQDDNGKQMRAVLFGVTGTASVYDGW